MDIRRFNRCSKAWTEHKYKTMDKAAGQKELQILQEVVALYCLFSRKYQYDNWNLQNDCETIVKRVQE